MTQASKNSILLKKKNQESKPNHSNSRPDWIVNSNKILNPNAKFNYVAESHQKMKKSKQNHK